MRAASQTAGAEARRAWASVQRLEDVGRASFASRALEVRLMSCIVIASEGGFTFGSPEHNALMERMREASARASHNTPPLVCIQH